MNEHNFRYNIYAIAFSVLTIFFFEFWKILINIDQRKTLISSSWRKTKNKTKTDVLEFSFDFFIFFSTLTRWWSTRKLSETVWVELWRRYRRRGVVKRKIEHEWDVRRKENRTPAAAHTRKPQCNGGKEIKDTHSMIREMRREENRYLQLKFGWVWCVYLNLAGFEGMGGWIIIFGDNNNFGCILTGCQENWKLSYVTKHPLQPCRWSSTADVFVQTL